MFMKTIQEIQMAVEKLSAEELFSFREWFSQFDAEIWDKKFESDVKSGKLDSFAKMAISDFESGNCRKIEKV